MVDPSYRRGAVVALRPYPRHDQPALGCSATGIQFAQLVKKNGGFVINDPDNLVQANNKLYLENFPKRSAQKPWSLATTKMSLRFLDEQQNKIILKPLKGSGGKNVFMIKYDERQNLKQTVEAISRDGYVIAQEYLPDAPKGDIRFFMLDGEPLVVNGKYAAVQRVQPRMRSAAIFTGCHGPTCRNHRGHITFGRSGFSKIERRQYVLGWLGYRRR